MEKNSFHYMNIADCISPKESFKEESFIWLITLHILI